jgi:hypothetical protein
MAIINNSELMQEITRATQLNSAIAPAPNMLNNGVQAVIEVNPRLTKYTDKLYNAVRTSSGTSNIRVLTANKDFYVTYACISFGCDILGATADCGIGVTINGQALDLIAIKNGATAGVQSRDLAVTFPIPIKIDRGSGMSFRLTFTAGTFVGGGYLAGYEVENITG